MTDSDIYLCITNIYLPKQILHFDNFHMYITPQETCKKKASCFGWVTSNISLDGNFMLKSTEDKYIAFFDNTNNISADKNIFCQYNKRCTFKLVFSC